MNIDDQDKEIRDEDEKNEKINDKDNENMEKINDKDMEKDINQLPSELFNILNNFINKSNIGNNFGNINIPQMFQFAQQLFQNVNNDEEKGDDCPIVGKRNDESNGSEASEASDEERCYSEASEASEASSDEASEESEKIEPISIKKIVLSYNSNNDNNSNSND